MSSLGPSDFSSFSSGCNQGGRSQAVRFRLPSTIRPRRDFLRLAMGLTAVAVTGRTFAEDLIQTPAQTEGPFYPDKLPLDTDNDLLIVNDDLTAAVGEVTHLSGRILGSNGSPLRGALVEIWQVDNEGSYLHSGGSPEGKRDKNFQGFGRFLTGASGEYYFRTIKPVKYPGRTPHIHFAVKTKGQRKFTTQCYIKGDPQNERDGVLRSIRNAKALESVMVDFAKIPDSKAGELAAKFDIVLGFTPEA